MEDKSAIELILMDFKHKCFPNYYGKYKYNICPGVNIDQTELIGEQSKYSLGTKSPTAFDKYRTNDIKNYIIKPFISIQDNVNNYKWFMKYSWLSSLGWTLITI